MHIMKLVQALRTEPWALMPEHIGILVSTAVRVVAGKMTADEAVDVLKKTEDHQVIKTILNCRGPGGSYQESVDYAHNTTSIASVDPQARETQTDGGAAGERPSIAVIPVRGYMAPRSSWWFGIGLVDLKEAVQGAAADSNVKGIILDIDSPGGSVYQVPEFADAVYEARQAKPVWSVANALAASAAYWVGSQADRFYASPSADVGSIGVWMAHGDYSKFYADVGVDVTLISAGKYKTEGHPFGPLGDEAKAALQNMVDENYAEFLAAVARGRGVSLEAVRDGMGEGRVVTAQNAKNMNMIDDLATFDQVVEMMLNEIAGAATGRGRAADAGEVPPRVGAGVSGGAEDDGDSDMPSEGANSAVALDQAGVETAEGAASETETERPFRGSKAWRKRKIEVLTSGIGSTS